MTTSATTSSALAAFPKFSELPTELRLQIIEETLDAVSSNDQQYPFRRKRCMSPYAWIDQEWNRVVELRLFKNIQLCSGSDDGIWTTSFIRQELDNFAAICGKRPGRLSKVILNFRSVIDPDLDSDSHLQILFQLFDMMRDWNPRDREQQGLVEVVLDYSYLRDFPVPKPDHSTDLDKFPKVPVIGSFHEPEPQYDIVRLHPGILASLCQKLPHARHASLTLPSGPCGYVSTQNFIDALDSLRVHKPGLAQLDLRAPCTNYWSPKALQSTLLPIMERLSASPSPWSDRLESLEIHHNIAVPDFLRAASKVTWPKLKMIKLSGAVDVRHEDSGDSVDRDDANAVAGTTCQSVLEALTTALPSMPKADRVHIMMIMNTLRPTTAFEVSVSLGNTSRAEKRGKILRCGDKFVPSSDSGVVKLEGICIPGVLAGQMQDTLRQHRRLELEVFACGKVVHEYQENSTHTPCVQWNQQTQSWDKVFPNDMDILIYEMGRYWESEW